MNKKCSGEEKLIGIILIKETPFKSGMSISTWEEKRAENARKAIENGEVIIIIDDPLQDGEVDKEKVSKYYNETILKRKK